MAPRRDAGFTRVPGPDGGRFQRASGRRVAERDAARARSLALPPAWTDVWISSDPRGHIQAVGVDEAGRQQYVYHPDWVAGRDRGKFAGALALAAALPAARARVSRALRTPGLGRPRVLAAAFRLLDDTALRVGSEHYLRRYGTRGLTTLRCRDASRIGQALVLQFIGKGGAPVRREIRDGDVAAVIAELVGSVPEARLLAYLRGHRRVPLRAHDVNEYVQQMTGGDYTAKDFRTLRGTAIAAQSLARAGPADTARDRHAAQRAAVADAAAFLGNTRAVAQRSYIDPRVFERYARGHVVDLRRTAEGGLRRLLEQDDDIPPVHGRRAGIRETPSEGPER